MGKTRRINLFLVLVLSIVAMLSAFFGVVAMPKSGNVRASAETVEYQDLLGVEDRSWGAASDEYYFGGVTLSPYGYFNTADSVSGCWYHGNNALISANNGVDILQYIYINDKSARDAITDNVNASSPMVGSSGWLTNPAASPVYVETTNGSGIIIKILKAYAGDSYTLTFKAGFSLIKNDGNVIYVSDDITYNCVGNVPTKVQKSTVTFTNESGTTVATKRVANGSAIGELPAVPAKSGYVSWWSIDGTRLTEETVISTNKTITPVYALEYDELLGLEDRTSWGAHEGEYYFGGINLDGGYFNTSASVSTTWYHGNTAPISANNGVDIMEYIYVNGISARELITANVNGANASNGSCGCWMSNPAAYPVYVETTTGSGIIIKIAKAYAGESFTITFKAGFTLIRNDNVVIYVSNDIGYTYANGTLVKDAQYVLTFEGVENRRIPAGATIGDLPEVPAKEGYVGVWTIDGVEITAGTVYNYGANKTAVAEYTKTSKDITGIFGLEDRAWGAHEGEYYFGGINLNGGYFNTAASVSNTWYVGNTAPINANNGVDIMQYIYVNGVSARKLITDNVNGAGASNGNCGCWMSNPYAYPVYVETTTGSGIIIRIAKAYAGDSVTISFKSGFSIIDANGDECVLKDTIQYTYENGAFTSRLVLKEYVLSFEGISETLSVTANTPIGQLPAVPAKAGYEGVWTIDGVAITAETVYNYGASKTAVASYTKALKDITNILGLEDRAWGAHEGEYYFGGINLEGGYFNTDASISTTWYHGNTAPINANNGVDIMEYIYVNGVSARQLITDNVNGANASNGNCGCWMSNPAAYPVYVETTTGSGIVIRIAKAYAGNSFTIMFKSGFRVVDATGAECVLNDAIQYTYANGVLGDRSILKEYVLSFEGISDTITVMTNQPIGTLPDVPAVDGEIPLYWEIDGVKITADTAWTYTENKTATPVYQPKYVLSFEGIGDTIILHDGDVIGQLPAVPARDGYAGVWTIDGVEITAETVYNYGANKTAVAEYTKLSKDITDILGLEDRTSWGAHEGEYYFGAINLNGGYFNTDASISTTWYHGNTAPINANNGVDIMEYIYVNGISARELIAANVNGANASNGNCGCWMSNPAAYPVYVETTTGSGIIIRIAKAYAGNSFTITFERGFSVIDADGVECVLEEGIQYTYANGAFTSRVVLKEYVLSFEGISDTITAVASQPIGTLPEVPAKDGYTGVWTIDGVAITAETLYNYGANKTAVAEYTKILVKTDVTDSIQIQFSAWNSTQSQFKIFINPSSELTTNAWWNIEGMYDQLIAANNGVDIMEYIYVNGQSIRELSDNNRANNTYPVGGATGWFTNSDQCRPVFVETNSEGIWVQVLHSFSTESFTVTLKAGFAILDSNGGVTVISKDVDFVCVNGGITKIGHYTLTFEGANYEKTVTTNQVIGELPEVPAVDGEIPLYWAIDGEKITAETVWTYSENKTAIPVYEPKYVLSFEGIADTITLHNGNVIGQLPAVPEKEGYTGAWTIDGVKITAETVYNYGANKTAVAAYTKIVKKVDVTDSIKIEFASFNETQSMFKIFINPSSELTTNAWWNIEGMYDQLIAANNGVDIMQYIYVNGENIRELSDNNRKDNIYPLGNATGWLTNSDQCRPVFVETNSDGIWVTVLHSFSSNKFTVTLKAGFEIFNSDGDISAITEDVDFVCTSGGGVMKVQNYTLTFEGADLETTVTVGQAIGDLPAVPAMEGYVGYWAIDGVKITATTVWNYEDDMVAIPTYYKDITNLIGLEDRAWGVCEAGAEYYLGGVIIEPYGYLNSIACGTWYVGNNGIIAQNGGVDIMEYIYVNGISARKLINDNVNGANASNACACWLSNPAAYPVYVETTNGSGIIIRIAKAYVGEYFEITFKSGFSLIDSNGDTVCVTKDVTYKYISDTLAKGEITDADLDNFNGKQITLMNGNETYLAKKTVQLTLPTIEAIVEGAELSQVLVGWTTDPNGLSDLYPAGYKFKPTSDVTLYAVWVGFDLQDGAAVRLVAGSSGIRFLTDIDASAYNNLVAKNLVLGVGTFVVPTEYLNLGAAFVHASFAEGYYVDKATELWKVNGEGDAVWTYAAAFVNISEAQFAKKLSARGYLKIQYTTGEGYIYTPYVEKLNSRSIYDVALAAYNDESKPQYKTNETILNYINKVANITWDYENDTFVRKEGVVGNYEITSIERDEGYTVKVMISGNVKSAMVNDVRIPEAGFENFKIGDFIFRIGEFKLIEGGFQFVLEAANDTYDKESAETLSFKSSDADLDFFLNDYFKRHSGYVENGSRDKVNSTVAGVNSQEFFSHEWMSMSYYWYNSFEGYTDEAGNNENRINGLREFLSTVPVDDYGYVWSSNDNVRDAYSDVSTGEQKMGWPFPNNDTVKTGHWEFNGGSEGSRSSNVSAKVSGGLYTASLNGQASNVTFTLTAPTSKKIYTFYAPLLEFEVRIDDVTNVEDIYVWYTTNSSTSFSEDKKVAVSEKAFLNYDISNASGEYNHVLYIPMYAESAWGESTSTYVKQIKVEIVLKSGKTLSGNVGLNYVRPTLDTRMSNNNSILISSLRQDYDYTGDLDYLAANVTRARKAMNFLMQMYDSSRGLKKESYLVGHGGTKQSLNWLGNAKAESIASSISQGYWDIMYMPEYDFQSNTYFYKALRDMAYLEGVLAANGITVEEDATVKTATRQRTTGTCAYNYDLNAVANTVLNSLRQTTEDTNHTGFWDATDGRFVAGYASGEGKWYDYGYVAWNLEAIYYGIATEEQAQAIMNWLASEEDLYKYVFAPISNTVTGDADMLNGEYAAKGDKWVNCQFGGAIMYTSFYDLMARIDTLGADNAFERLMAIQAWYEEVYNYYVANGTDPYDFYRYYYNAQGIQCQGMGTAGEVGLDREFLESFLPVSAVAYGFFGVEASGNNLTVAPQLPADLSFWKMENLAFNFVKYDLTIYGNAIQLNNVRGDATGLTITVALDYEEGQSVYVNGKKLQSGYTVENGKIIVTVAMGATIVEVR